MILIGTMNPVHSDYFLLLQPVFKNNGTVVFLIFISSSSIDNIRLIAAMHMLVAFVGIVANLLQIITGIFPVPSLGRGR